MNSTRGGGERKATYPRPPTRRLLLAAAAAAADATTAPLLPSKGSCRAKKNKTGNTEEDERGGGRRRHDGYDESGTSDKATTHTHPHHPSPPSLVSPLAVFLDGCKRVRARSLSHTEKKRTMRAITPDYDI